MIKRIGMLFLVEVLLGLMGIIGTVTVRHLTLPCEE